MESVLIVDDDIELCIMLRDYFELQQIGLAMRHDGRLGLQAALEGDFDLVILDVMLPGMDGFEILRRLRAASEIGILMLTSRGEDDERVLGLENGADDYVPKPFNPRELLARMRAILRRRSVNGPPGAEAAATPKLSHGGFLINSAALTAHYRGVPLALSPIELLLLEALLQSPGTVVPREDLVERIFQRAYHPMDRGLDMLVSRLRRKLDIADNPGALIKTVRSAGYLFALPD
jgi:two-component system response regulator CpxR